MVDNKIATEVMVTAAIKGSKEEEDLETAVKGVDISPITREKGNLESEELLLAQRSHGNEEDSTRMAAMPHVHVRITTLEEKAISPTIMRRKDGTLTRRKEPRKERKTVVIGKMGTGRPGTTHTKRTIVINAMQTAVVEAMASPVSSPRILFSRRVQATHINLLLHPRKIQPQPLSLYNRSTYTWI